ncbi:hypothetical protein [Lichenibacterium dinghuense]|uniref:hypothetical protein n=1 Tax=Lichenibacterium dinghuense TaxID=2895977 RepID=UPI001F458918|nr:hypothetical protein [Lichenibacterium sp. 6Y81]
MQLDTNQTKLLRWVEAKEPVLGIFFNMSELDPMISGGLVEKRPVPRQKGQLVLTEAGKAALEAAH